MDEGRRRVWLENVLGRWESYSRTGQMQHIRYAVDNIAKSKPFRAATVYAPTCPSGAEVRNSHRTPRGGVNYTVVVGHVASSNCCCHMRMRPPGPASCRGPGRGFSKLRAVLFDVGEILRQWGTLYIWLLSFGCLNWPEHHSSVVLYLAACVCVWSTLQQASGTL